MSFSKIQPIMFQPHPAFAAQAETLTIAYGERVSSIIPKTDLEHERWRARDPLSRLAQYRAGRSLRGADDAIGYVVGSFLPKDHDVLKRYPFVYLDIDDPLSLFGHGMRNSLPLVAYRKLATKFATLDSSVRLNFWGDVQIGNFLANLPADMSAKLLESGFVSVLPPAIRPQVTKSALGRDDVLKCLCIASGKFWHKGVADAVAAVSLLAERGCAIALTVVADGIPDEWLTFIKSKPYFSLLSRISRDQMNELFRNHDALVFMSHHDTFGWVVLEAKSFGLPAISTDFYNRPELISHGRDGLLIRDPFNNPFYPVQPEPYGASHLRVSGSRIAMSGWIEFYIEALATGLESLANDRAMLQSLGDNALASVQPDAKFGVNTRLSKLASRLPLP